MRALVRYLFARCSATDIYVDPLTQNLRAIRSYEKCGFHKVKVLKDHELFDGVYQNSQLMKIAAG